MSTEAVTVNALTYAKKLRAHVTSEKKKREHAIARYKAKLAAWREELAAWLRTVGVERARKAKPSKNSRWSNATSLDMGDLLRGAPKPPEPPGDKHIRQAQAALRHIAITGATKVRVSSDDVAKIFPPPAGS